MSLVLVSPTPSAADTLCVNPWGTSGCYPSIQEAIDAALAGDAINVAAGTYVEDITLKAGVSVIGAGGGSSIIQGTGGAPRTRAPVVTANDSSIASDTLLQGFTLTGGNVNVTDAYSYGGGVYIVDGASPTIKDNLITGNRATMGGGIYIAYSSNPVIEGNTIKDNRADRIGGGIMIERGSNPVIKVNTITANDSVNAGGIYIKESSPTVSNNQITQNNATEGGMEPGTGFGGGMAIVKNAAPIVTSNVISGNVSSCDGGGINVQENSAPTVTGNTIQSNHAAGTGPCGGLGGGIKFWDRGSGIFEDNIVKENIAAAGGGGFYVEMNSTPTINGNKIINNEAQNGGGIITLSGSNPTITNNYIVRNKVAEHGGGIYVNDSAPTIRNNTIVANNALGIGEGVYIWPVSATPTIVNNIIVNNNYGIQRAFGPFLGIADYNDVWNNILGDYVSIDPGPHDISADPLFVDAANDNYQLSIGSPAIDAGTNAGAPATDIDGGTRPQDGDGDGSAIVDMGAHEANPPSAQLAVSPAQAIFNYDPNDPVGSPSPVFTGTTTVQNTGISRTITYTVTPPTSPPFAVTTTLDPLSGSLTPLGSTDFRYNIDVSGLITGTYDATFTISAIQDGGESAPGSPTTHQVQAVIGSSKRIYLPIIIKNG